MTPLVILVVLAVAAAVLIPSLKGLETEKRKYEYGRKQFFMTRAEHDFFDVLTEAVGNEYVIFAQVHLPTLVDQKIRGQNWKAAFRHISQKSVDFVLCDKTYLAPKLAIELDDKSHERPDRQDRDIEVERILKEAAMPLLRIANQAQFNRDELRSKVHDALNAPAKEKFQKGY